MATVKRLTARQVLARMRRGDLPCHTGAGGFVAVFADGMKAGHQTMRKLEQDGLVDRPVGSSISSTWTLPVMERQQREFDQAKDNLTVRQLGVK